MGDRAVPVVQPHSCSIPSRDALTASLLLAGSIQRHVSQSDVQGDRSHHSASARPVGALQGGTDYRIGPQSVYESPMTVRIDHRLPEEIKKYTSCYYIMTHLTFDLCFHSNGHRRGDIPFRLELAPNHADLARSSYRSYSYLYLVGRRSFIDNNTTSSWRLY